METIFYVLGILMVVTFAFAVLAGLAELLEKMSDD